MDSYNAGILDERARIVGIIKKRIEELEPKGYDNAEYLEITGLKEILKEIESKKCNVSTETCTCAKGTL